MIPGSRARAVPIAMSVLTCLGTRLYKATVRGVRRATSRFATFQLASAGRAGVGVGVGVGDACP
jgi:hypothetical protein